MITKVYTGILLCLALMQQVRGQQQDVLFRGEFSASTFTEFAGELEKTTDARFFYLESWVRGIRISVSGKDLSLDRILSEVLLPAGFFFHIDEAHRVYLNPDRPYLSTLPDYSRANASVDLREDEGQTQELTRTEQRYIEGRKA